MYLFLIPLLGGFVFNWASAFTHLYSKRWGERAGQLTCFIFRNILGIPVWVFGLVLAARASAAPFFTPGPLTKVLGWLLLVLGSFSMVWGLFYLRLRAYRPTEHDTLVKDGIFKHIRHPIYSGLLIDFLAIILLRPAKPMLIACILGWGFVLIQARLEEIDLVERIPAYREYMQQVPRFFPRFWK